MGELFIETENRNGKTVISDSFFTAPFKIAKPFYNGKMCEIMIMQASAGILDGDNLSMKFNIKDGSRVMITGQSYTKLFKMDRAGAVQNVKITVGSKSTLYFLPCPVIPFKGSNFKNTNEISLMPDSRLVVWDIFAAGRIAMGERFGFEKYHSRTIVKKDKKVIFADNARYVPKEFDLSRIGYFEGHSHVGTAYFFGFRDLKQYFDNKIHAALTNANEGQLVRILADSGEEITDYLKNIIIKEEKYGE